MSDEPYPPLRPQRPVPQRRQSTPWLMILGVAVLALLAGAVVAILIGERDGDGVGASPAGSGSASPPPSATQSGSATPSASASPSASGSTAVALTVGGFVAPAVDGVTLRETPSTSGTRIGILPRDSVNIVVEGPVEADGYRWYRLSASGLPPSSGCTTPLPTNPLACPIWFGWAAVQDPTDGTPWFASTDVDCPDPATETGAFLALPRWIPVGCYGTTELSFTAWYPEVPDGGPGGPCTVDPAVAWLYCADLAHDVWTSSEDSVAFQRLFIDPDSGVTLPARGQWLQIRGAFDHPDAPLCAAAEEQFNSEDPNPDLAVLECRSHFVVRAVEVTAAP